MSLPSLSTAPSALPERRADSWAAVDAILLFLVLAVSSDMLVQTGKLQSLVWMICYGLTLLRVAMLWPYYVALVGRNMLVFAYPLACLASVLWSYSRGSSLVSATQLTMTIVIASYIGWRYSLNVIMKAMALVFSLAILLSLLHWATGVFPWPVYTRAGGLAGLFSHKNMLGQRTLFAIVAILAIWAMRPSEASRAWKMGLIIPMLLTLVALGLSRSMTAVLLAPALVALWFLLNRRRVPGTISIPAAGLALMALAVTPVVLNILRIDPVKTVLESVGKTSTLTGRTTLWDVALQVSAEHPFLGVGYGAFWKAPQFFNERLVTQHAGAVTSNAFHNFVLEILVSAGWPALIAMLSLIVATIARLYRLHTDRGSAAASGALVMVAAIVVTSLLGTSLFRGHEFMIILVVAFHVSSQEDRSLRPGGFPV